MAAPAASVSGQAGGPVERFYQVSLLCMLSSGYCAVAGSGVLDKPTVVLAGLSLLARLAMIVGWLRVTVGDRVATAATILYIGFYPIDYNWVSGDFLGATVHLVFFLAIVKVLTAQTNRDYFFLKVLAFLQLLAASVLSASLSFFFYLGLFLLFTVATFASNEIRRASAEREVVVRHGLRRMPGRLGVLCITVTAAILVVSGGLFLVLPRTAQAAIRRFPISRSPVSGFSSRVTLGQTGQIGEENTPVMHVVLPETRRGMDLKWRGIALGRFDGRQWTNPFTSEEPVEFRGPTAELRDLRRLAGTPGEFAQYDVVLRSTGTDMLFFAGQPVVLRIGVPRVMRTALDSYRVVGAADDLHYTVSGMLGNGASGVYPADPRELPAPTLPPALRSVFLELPRIDDRIRDLAADVVFGSRSDLERAARLERHLRTRYAYTRQLLDAPVRDPLANFLFERKKGHCEYFASAMAVMLRAVGIPSRVVTGFQSGVYNPITGKQVIRASDAHSWVEAWLEERGWTTFDPTPPGEAGPLYGIASRLALYLDAADTLWQDWVVNYDLEQQLNLASSVRSSPTWSLGWLSPIRWARQWAAGAMAASRRWAVAAVILLAVALALWLWGPKVARILEAHWRVHKVKRGAVTASDATLLYQRMLACLRRRGFQKPPWLTPAEFARLLPAGSQAAALVEGITGEYQMLRYGQRRECGPRMLALIERLEALREV